MSEIKERPILFNGPMVRAILDGRKTVTRRVIKLQPDTTEERLRELGAWVEGLTISQHLNNAWRAGFIPVTCPFGEPGDRLWVRETWGVISHAWDEQGNMVDWSPDRPATPIRELPFGQGYYSGHAIYAADGPMEWAGDDDGGGEPRSAWKPSIHMPRAASRILLEITDVRIERLQDITYEDAVAEGVYRDSSRVWTATDEGGACHKYPEPAFRDLWQTTGGDWDANPWVWVVEFRRITE
ncbi:hypothetical protein [Pseudomonas sp.]|uniref:hypothetical protein n=1 Tax=Pseudomonas sp. TaxID=306 RepID=UPI001A0E0365|nr:hypothetical protein [Pseudomonas sp.]MBF0675544.1 hypothetical protein [Pseudomonas sp.]